LILADKVALTWPKEKENLLKTWMHFSDDRRLACQTYVKGNGVRFTRIIMDESDIDLYIGVSVAAFTEYIGTEKKVVTCFINIRDLRISWKQI
jgi:adenylate cyclase